MNGAGWIGRGILPLDLVDLAAALHGSASYTARHLRDVYTRLIRQDSRAVRLAGAFHDSLEEGVITEEALRLVAGDQVADLVLAVTRREGESYADYIQRVKASGPAAVAIKLADLRSNLAADPPPTLRKRYRQAVRVLTNDD